MHLFRSIGVSSRAWLSVLRVAFRPVLWLPFLLIAAVQLGVLALLIQFHRPAFMPFTLPVIQQVGGEQATHYPFFFFHLPEIQSQVGLVFAILFESLAVGAATLLFARAFGMQDGFRVRGNVGRLIPRLILATAIPAAVIFAIGKTVVLVPEEVLRDSSGARWATRAGYLLVVTLVQCLVAYVAAWIVLRGAGPIGALRDSIRVSLRTFLPTFIVIGVPIALLFPFHYVARRSDLFLNKLSPETVAGVLAARSLVEIVLGFMLVGAVTRLFLWRMEAPR